MDNQTTATPSVASYVARYRSRNLTDDQTALWITRLRQLVIAAVPVNEQDAKGMMTAGTRFLTDLCGAELLAVDAVLRADGITRCAHRDNLPYLGLNPVHAHHDQVHATEIGQDGRGINVRGIREAGHAVVPTAPITSFFGCP